jgi:bifunctional non-homologous end joining protein LigD
VDEAMIDGEAVVLMDDGRSDFHALLTRRRETEAGFVAFDLLRLIERLAPLLERTLPPSPFSALVVKRFAEQGSVAALRGDEPHKARELGLEGIVSKREGGFYKSGRSRNWLRTVNPDFVRP